MFPRTRFRRRFTGRRRRNRYIWARTQDRVTAIVAPPAPTNYDLLSQYRTASGFILELPDLAIWRIHLKITIRFRFTSTTVQTDTGVGLAIFCDGRQEEIQAALLNFFAGATSSAYTEQFLMWDHLMAGSMALIETLNDVPNTTNDQFIYKEYDIRSHRRLRNLDETLWMSLSTQGSLSISEFAVTASTLLKLPH